VIPSTAQGCGSTGCKLGQKCVKSRCKWADICGIRRCSNLGPWKKCVFLQRVSRGGRKGVETTCGRWSRSAFSRWSFRSLRRRCPRKCRRQSRTVYDKNDRPYCNVCLYRIVSYVSGFRKHGRVYRQPSCVRAYGGRCFKFARNKCLCRPNRRRRRWGSRRERRRNICRRISPVCRRYRRFCICPLIPKKRSRPSPSSSPTPSTSPVFRMLGDFSLDSTGRMVSIREKFFGLVMRQIQSGISAYISLNINGQNIDLRATSTCGGSSAAVDSPVTISTALVDTGSGSPGLSYSASVKGDYSGPCLPQFQFSTTYFRVPPAAGIPVPPTPSSSSLPIPSPVSRVLDW